MKLFKFDVTHSPSFFGALDTPIELTKVGNNFEIRGWVCGVGTPATVSVRTSEGTSKAEHQLRFDVNRHVDELRKNSNSHFYAYAFSAKVTDVEEFELVVETHEQATSWIRATNVRQEFSKSFEEASLFFSDADFLSNLRWSEDLGSHFESHGKPKYFILGSVEIVDSNFVLLRDNTVGSQFILAQRVIAAELLCAVELEELEVLHPGHNHVNQRLRSNAELLLKRAKGGRRDLPSTNSEKPVFGIGYLSIHHYFYDTLPGLLSMSLKLHRSIPKRLVNHDREYFDTKVLLEGHWVKTEAPSGGNDFFSLDQSPVLLAGQNFSQIGDDIRGKLDRSIVFHSSESNDAIIESRNPIIWFDTSTKNRSWNMEEVFRGLMVELLDIYQNPTFVLDGLTARWNESPNALIPDWVYSIPDIERAKLIPLNFARADEKIRWAFHVDFFFASYTTGSMFVHRFAAAPGIAMSAPRTVEHERIHLHGKWRKIIIPTSLFLSQDLDADPAWASFQINERVFTPWALHQAQRFLPLPTRSRPEQAFDNWVNWSP